MAQEQPDVMEQEEFAERRVDSFLTLGQVTKSKEVWRFPLLVTSARGGERERNLKAMGKISARSKREL